MYRPVCFPFIPLWLLGTPTRLRKPRTVDPRQPSACRVPQLISGGGAIAMRRGSFASSRFTVLLTTSQWTNRVTPNALCGFNFIKHFEGKWKQIHRYIQGQASTRTINNLKRIPKTEGWYLRRLYIYMGIRLP